ncbi:MAG: ectoine hydroxylase-related dioxygenase (phytanoyl-CoA dioxygenase family) [Verrucomicrobiales bacterium]
MNTEDSIERIGFAIVRSVFDRAEVEELRTEARRIAEAAGQACLRDLFNASRRFKELASARRIVSQLAPDRVPVRGILFDKTPQANWPVPWHQDLTIAVKQRADVPGYGPWTVKDGIPHVQPPLAVLESMRTIRIHLDETSVTNGALRVLPMSHLQRHLAAELLNMDSRNEVLCKCSPGDVFVMSPLLLHASSRSVTPFAPSRSPIRIRTARSSASRPSVAGMQLTIEYSVRRIRDVDLKGHRHVPNLNFSIACFSHNGW